jgi:hypothetical protein
MAKEATEIEIPSAPAHLPAALQNKWSKTYAAAHTQAQTDIPNDASGQKQAARKEANKLLRIAAPASHKEAAAMVEDFQAKNDDAWKVIGHGKRVIQGVEHLQVVTSDGKKHAFPVPAGKAAKD